MSSREELIQANMAAFKAKEDTRLDALRKEKEKRDAEGERHLQLKAEAESIIESGIANTIQSLNGVTREDAENLFKITNEEFSQFTNQSHYLCHPTHPLYNEFYTRKQSASKILYDSGWLLILLHQQKINVIPQKVNPVIHIKEKTSYTVERITTNDAKILKEIEEENNKFISKYTPIFDKSISLMYDYIVQYSEMNKNAVKWLNTIHPIQKCEPKTIYYTSAWFNTTDLKKEYDILFENDLNIMGNNIATTYKDATSIMNGSGNPAKRTLFWQDYENKIITKIEECVPNISGCKHKCNYNCLNKLGHFYDHLTLTRAYRGCNMNGTCGQHSQGVPKITPIPWQPENTIKKGLDSAQKKKELDAIPIESIKRKISSTKEYCIKNGNYRCSGLNVYDMASMEKQFKDMKAKLIEYEAELIRLTVNNSVSVE
jgi:hypothetical protein